MSQPNPKTQGEPTFNPGWERARRQVRRQAVEAFAASRTAELGTPGTWVQAGRIYGVEHNRALSYDKALGRGTTVGVWERMEREDPQIAAMLRSLTSVLLAAPWRIEEPVDGDELDERIADEIREELEELEGGWKGWLRQSLTFVSRGFSVFEVVYKRRADGRIGLAKFAPRLQRTVHAWRVGDSEDLETVEFDAPFGGDAPRIYGIPAAKLLLLSLNREGNNFEGVSLLRPCYTDWLLKRQVLRATSIDIERAGHGFMRFRQTEREATATDDDIDAFHTTALNWRTNEFAHSIEPWGWEMEFAFPEVPLDKRVEFLRYLDQQIAKAFLATFLELGLDKAGTQALGGTLTEHFMLALRSIADVVEEAINAPGGSTVNGPIRRLVDWNHGARAAYPKFRFGDINPQAAREALDRIVSGADAGVFGQFGAADHAYSRSLVGLPEAEKGDEPEPAFEQEPDDEPEPALEQEPDDEPEPALEQEPDDELEPALEDEGDDVEPMGISAGRRRDVDQVDAVGVRFRCHRPLTGDESVVAFSEIAGLFDGASQTFRGAVEETLATIGAELAGEVRAIMADDRLDTPRRLRRIADLRIGSEQLEALTDAIEAHVAEVAATAKGQAAREVRRQAMRGGVQQRQKADGRGARAATALEDIDLEELADIVRGLSTITATRMGGEIMESVRSAGTRAATLGPAGAAQALADVDRTVTTRADGFFRKHAATAVAPAVNAGRIDGSVATLRELGLSKVDHVQFSSVLDAATCGPCDAVDGEEIVFGSSRYFELLPPYQRCDGRTNCRCIYVVVGSK